MTAWKRLLLMLGLFAVFEGAYQLALYFEKRYFPETPVCIIVMFVIVGALLAAIMILSRGFENKVCTPDDFDPSLPYEKRAALAEKNNKNKKTARVLMTVFVPLSAVLALDLIDLYLNIFDMIGDLFS